VKKLADIIARINRCSSPDAAWLKALIELSLLLPFFDFSIAFTTNVFPYNALDATKA